MHRPVRVALAALLVAPLALVAADPVDAAPPTVSATSGAPGTVVEVSSPDCVSDEEQGQFRILQARLISGVAPNEVLAGAGGGGEGTTTVVVPDWVDPDAPASIEAACLAIDFDPDEELSEFPEPVITPLDPVAFDILPGPGAPTQVRSYSRTSLLVGQGFTVSGQGCDLPGATYAGVDLSPGDDPSGRTFAPVAGGAEELTGTDYEVGAVLADSGVDFSWSIDGGDPPVLSGLEVDERPSTIEPGTYTAVSYCADEEGDNLLYEPQRIEVTGTAPVGEVDLTVAPGSDLVTLAGSSCTAGPVSVFLEAVPGDLLLEEDELFDAESGAASTRGRTGDRRAERSGPFALPVPSPDAPAAGGSRPSTRALADEEFLEAEVDPAADGTWSISDAAGFEEGFVFGSAVCGDPFGDGFVYDEQGVALAAEATPPTVPPTTPTTPPATPPPAAPGPAVAIPGTPAYTG
ncbi:MAG TPA: hypothetical protein VHK88_17620 [Aquihabitans sp.]|nr:hypothetical protein [Aquihabitans sp.]